MKKIALFMGRLMGLLMIFISIVSNIIADGFKMKEIKELMEIFSQIDKIIMNKDMLMFKIILILSNNSHLIITIALIWLVFLSFLQTWLERKD